jgi:hypothetical protein
MARRLVDKGRMMLRSLVSVRVTCSKCDRTRLVRTTQPELYTKEVRENYLCLECKPRRQRQSN